MLEAVSPRARLARTGVLATAAGVLLAFPLTSPVPTRDRCGDAAAVCASPRTAVDWQRSASFERSLNRRTDGWNLPPMPQASGFTVTRSREVGGATGSYAAKIVSHGGNGGCSCPRMRFEHGFRYAPGREVWLRGAWYFRDPSAVTWSRMMNLSSYRDEPATDFYTGLVLEGRAGRMLVRTRRYQSTAGQRLVFPSRRIPVGRWFTVVLHMRLSPTDGRALNEWYVDGRLVGRNSRANMHNGQPMNVYQGGMPYFLEGIRSTVYFDDPGLKAGRGRR